MQQLTERQGPKLRVHDLLPLSRVNGPGRRGVLWLQGCPFDCAGCFNQAARSRQGGHSLSIPELLAAFDFSAIEGVTLSGGEPFLQPAALYALCVALRRQGMTLLVYSGYTLEELRSHADPNCGRILELVDILIDGPYRADSPPRVLWAGSGNQRVHFLSGRYAGYATEIVREERLAEIHIDAGGGICVTGF